MNTEESVMAPQNSEFQEHSRNSLESAAGEAPELVSEQRSVKQVFDLELHSNASEYREHSHKLRIKQVRIEEMTVSTEDTKRTAASSDFPEDSPNSLPSGKCEMDNGEAKVSFGDRDGQC